MLLFFFFKQKTAYEMRISDWSSDVCSSDLWPGYLGGIDWGGISVDKGRHLMFVNNNQVSNYNRLLTRATADRLGVKPMTAAHMSDVGGPVPQAGVPYAANIAPFLSPLAIPCQQPPYGMVSAVDLKSGKLVWRSEEHTSELQS